MAIRLIAKIAILKDRRFCYSLELFSKIKTSSFGLEDVIIPYYFLELLSNIKTPSFHLDIIIPYYSLKLFSKKSSFGLDIIIP